MLRFDFLGFHCQVSLLFPAMLTTLLLWRPDSLAIPCVLASLMHEGGHLLAMLLCKIPPGDFTLGVFGARIQLRDGRIGYAKNLIVSLGGPLINILLCFIMTISDYPISAAVHFWLAAINMLPAMGLDGGEILRCVLCLCDLEHQAMTILRVSSVLTLLPIATGGIYMLLQGANGSLFIVAFYLTALIFFADKNEKNS